jgi:hypothetical protein
VLDNIAGQTQTVQGAIDALKAANAMVAALSQLLAELQAEAPAQAADESDEEFQKRLADRQKKLQEAEAALKKAQEAVNKAVAAVDAAQKELQKLQGSDLPEAQAKDAAEMERYFADEKKKLAAAQEQNTSTFNRITAESDDKDDSAAQTETKTPVKKAPTASTAPTASSLPVDN